MTVDVTGRSGLDAVRAPAERTRRLRLARDAAPEPAPGPRGTTALVDELVAIAADIAGAGAVPALRRALDDVLEAWAIALVRTHRMRLSPFSPVAALPWVLDEPLPAWLDDLPAGAGPVWAVRAHPGVRRAVAAARASWSAVQWIHGCPTGDDVVLVPRGDAWRAELSSPQGRGDPRWDVATVLDWLATTLGPALDPGWRIDPGAAFLAAYRAVGGAATPSRAMAVARTVLTAVEWSAELAAGQDPDDDDLTWLAGLWTRPLELIGAARPASVPRG